MKLTDLRPQFRQGEPQWGDTDDFAKAIAVEFDCPGCVGKPWSHRIWAPFLGTSWKTAVAWQASGSGYHDLTFSDAPGHSRSIRMLSGCRSHFNITAGAIDFYGDSGHTQYQPQEKPVTQTTDTAAPADATAKTEEAAAAPKPVVPPQRIAIAPPGYAKTSVLQWIEGVLHQLHESAHPGQDPSQVLVPVPGAEEHQPITANAALELVKGRIAALEGAVETRLAAIEKSLKLATPTA